jgi:hypothetical protein
VPLPQLLHWGKKKPHPWKTGVRLAEMESAGPRKILAS